MRGDTIMFTSENGESSPLTINKRRGDPRDAEIGKRIRARRLERGLSQTELGQRLGVTFQQIQKYEKGANRVGAGRLQRIAEVLDVPITFFYDGLGTAPNVASE